MSFIKKLISKFATSEKKSELKENKSKDVFLNQNVRDFLDGKKTSITAQEAFPHLKVFQPFKIPKNPSIVEIKPRLENALNYLHLPAAYKDILICLRMIIRIKRKRAMNYENELLNLYKYACQYNFFNAEPYLKKAKEPAFNLEEVIDKNFFNNNQMPYKDIGYEKIQELNKTDIKWLISEFGDPNSHYSAADYHRKMRDKIEKLLIDKRKKESDAIWNYNNN